MRSMLKICACLLPLMVSTTIADAARLKSDISVYSDFVTAGDLFEDAGRFADEALFRSPDLGQDGVISAERVLEAARDIGMFELEAGSARKVRVFRPSRPVLREDVLASVRNALSDRLNEDENGFDFSIADGQLANILHARHDAEQPFVLSSVGLSANEQRFEATITLQAEDGAQVIRFVGNVERMVDMPVLASALEEGEIIGSSDIIYERVPRQQIRSGRSQLLDVESLMGLAAKRAMRAGSRMRASDFTTPLLVRRNDLVTLTYKVPGLVLTVQGRSLSDGGLGETINVMNLQSNRTVRGEVTATGEVSISSNKPLTLSGLSPRLTSAN